MENREEEDIAKKSHAQERERLVQSKIEDVGRFEELVEVQLPAKRRRIAAMPEIVVDLEAGEDEKKATTGRRKRGKIDR